MKNQVINIHGIDVTLFKSNRAKNVNITIKPFSGVRVSVPQFLSFNKAKEITEKRISWIKSNLSKMKKAEDMFTLFNFDTKFKTRSHDLDIKVTDSENLKSIVRNNKISVFVPENYNIESNKVQIEIRKAIEIALRKEAKDHLPPRVKELAEKHNFKYKKVAIKNAKTRWGSCSYVNNINLSLHLMRLPDYLIDYVILHELVHTKIKNHSKDFWHFLDYVSGNAKKLDKELKDYRTHIY